MTGEGRRRGRFRPWFPALALWLTPLAAFCVLLVVTLAVEASSTTSAPPGTAQVGERVRDLRTSVVASLELGDGIAALAGIDGVVTTLYLDTGTEVVDGTPLVAINGVPVLAHLGATPFYRPLARGAVGADVTELQSYLARLGFTAPAPNGTVDRATVAAIREFQKSLGVPDDGVFSPHYVAFLPPDPGLVESIEVRVGDSVVASDAIVTFVRPILAVAFEAADESKTLRQFAAQPVRLLAGENEIAVTSVAPIPEDLAAISELISDGVADGTLTADDSEGRRVVRGLLLALRDPVTVGAVPADAVYVSPAGRLCIFLRTATGATDAAVVGTDTASSAEIGVAYVDAGYVGETVVALPTRLPDDVLAECA